MQQSIPTIQELLASGINDTNNRNILLKRLHYKYKAFCKNSKCKTVVDKLDLEIKFQEHIYTSYGLKFNLFTEIELANIYTNKAIIVYPAAKPAKGIVAKYLQSDLHRWLFPTTVYHSNSHRA